MTPTAAKTSSNGTAAPGRREPADGVPSQLAYLTRVLKMPTVGRTWEQLAEHARDENWSHEEFLAAVLARQVADRESAGSLMRTRTAHFPAVKTLEDFNLDHLPSLRRDVLAHLATGTFVAKAENVILLGPPGIGKTHLAIGLGVKAAQTGYSVLFDTANNWIARLAAAHQAGHLDVELKRSAATGSSSSTKSATSPSTTTPPTSSSNSSPHATNKAPSWSPQTSRSAGGEKRSPTTLLPPQ